MRWLSIFVAGYMLLALMWWMVLLLHKNKEIYRLELLNIERTGFAHNHKIYAPLKEARDKEAKKQQMMIIGEGVVFVGVMLIGIYLIQRAYKREIKASMHQNNFLLAVTHELKTPLTTMKMGLQTLMRPRIAEEQKTEIINDALYDADRLELLIEDLLMASKMSSNYLFTFERHDVASLIQDVKDSFRNVTTSIDIHLSAPQSSLITNIDQKAFKIAISNLISNAIKYAPQSPININISKSSDANHLYITISDHGPGISSDEKKYIFDRFYRPGQEEVRQNKGTGLGLYIVKKIIEGHHGSISVHDNKPQGCTFEMKIPITV